MFTKNLVLSGGGTGGHIYPALALATAVRERYPDVKINYIGRKNGMEADIVTKIDSIDFYEIEMQGLVRKYIWRNFKTMGQLIRAISQCKKYLKEIKPDVVIGTGGYVSAPALYAASCLKIPTLIHEQNVIPGLTTKLLARFVDRVAISFEGSSFSKIKKEKLILTGNPRASEVASSSALEGRKQLGLSDTLSPIVLMLGGSLGAANLNKALTLLARDVNKLDHIQFVYITGKGHYDAVMDQLGDDCPQNLKVFPFLYNMPPVLAATTLVVARAGATMLAELTALGIPSILIPSPYVTNNHQEKNAGMLEARNAAHVILEKDLTSSNLFELISSLLGDHEKLSQMSLASKTLGMPHASTTLVSELERMCL